LIDAKFQARLHTNNSCKHSHPNESSFVIPINW